MHLVDQPVRVGGPALPGQIDCMRAMVMVIQPSESQYAPAALRDKALGCEEPVRPGWDQRFREGGEWQWSSWRWPTVVKARPSGSIPAGTASHALYLQ